MWGQSLKIIILGGDEAIKSGNYIPVKSSLSLLTQWQGVLAGQDNGSSLETQREGRWRPRWYVMFTEQRLRMRRHVSSLGCGLEVSLVTVNVTVVISILLTNY